MAVNIKYDDSVLVNIFEGLKKQSYQKFNFADNYSKFIEQFELAYDSIKNVVSFRFSFGEVPTYTYKKIDRYLSLDLNSLTDNQTLFLTVNYKIAKNNDFIWDEFKDEYTSKVNIDFRDQNWRIELFKKLSNVALQEFSEYLTEKPELLKELSSLIKEFIQLSEENKNIEKEEQARSL